MNGFSLEFDRPDLTAWLWLALGAGLGYESFRMLLLFARRQRSLRTAAIAVALAGASCLCLLKPPKTHVPALVGLFALAMLWSMRSYARTTRPLSRPRRGLLLLLRGASLLTLLALVAGPILEWTSRSPDRQAVLVLLDDSASMQVRDVPDSGGTATLSRLEATQRALRSARVSISRAQDVLDLQWVRFTDESTPARTPEIEAKGTATALLDALVSGQQQTGATAARLAGIILISDGRDNASARPPRETQDLLATSGIPLLAFGVGSDVPSGQTRSLAARRLDCPTRVSLLNSFSVHAEFQAAGLAGQEVRIRMLYDGVEVAEQTYRPQQLTEVLTFDPSYVPTTDGVHRVVVEATSPALSGPAAVASLSAFVQVIDDELRVLYLDRPRYERAAISRALAAARDFRVVRMEVPPSGVTRPPFDWRPFSAVILGDIDRGTLTAAEIDALRTQVVEQGRGLALLGGLRSLGEGNLAGTPLEALLPVSLSETRQIERRLKLAITPTGRLHPILVTGTPEDPASFWSALPELQGASGLGTVRPAAQVLAKSDAGEPMLVIQELGKGRSAVVAFDSTWRWSLGSDRGADAQRRFWRQLTLWLAQRRPQVWVNVERPRYQLNRLRARTERVTIQAGASRGPQPLVGLKLEGTLHRVAGPTASAPASTQPAVQKLTWTQAGSAFEAQPEIDQAGEYRVHVTATDAAGPVGEAEAAFFVESTDRELTEPLADLELLRRLAASTESSGGAFLTLDQLSQAFNRFAAAAQTTVIPQVHRQRLVADQPWGWLIAFALCLTAEWTLRRRTGLV